MVDCAFSVITVFCQPPPAPILGATSTLSRVRVSMGPNGDSAVSLWPHALCGLTAFSNGVKLPIAAGPLTGTGSGMVSLGLRLSGCNLEYRVNFV
jgi:hypothetical protein